MSDIPKGEIRDARELPVIFVHSAIDDAGLSSAEFRVYAHLARRANGRDKAWPGVESIADKCKINHKTAREALKQLVKQHFIAVIVRPGDTNEYILLHHSEWILDPSQNERTPPETVGHPSQNERTKVIHEGNPNPSKEGARKRAVSNVITADDLTGYVFPPSLETEDFHDAVEEWRAYKTGELRERFTRRMLTVILEDGIKRGAKQYAADIRFSIRKTWRGIHPEKPVNGTAKKEASVGWAKSDTVPPPPEASEEQLKQVANDLRKFRKKIRGGPAADGEKSQYEE